VIYALTVAFWLDEEDIRQNVIYLGFFWLFAALVACVIAMRHIPRGKLMIRFELIVTTAITTTVLVMATADIAFDPFKETKGLLYLITGPLCEWSVFHVGITGPLVWSYIKKV